MLVQEFAACLIDGLQYTAAQMSVQKALARLSPESRRKLLEELLAAESRDITAERVSV